MKRRLLIGCLAFLAVMLVLTASLYWSGWRTARAAATAIALGRQDGSSFGADPSYFAQLGRPEPESLRVSTLFDENSFIGETPTAFQVNFALSNLEDDSVSMIELGVSVRLGLSGWQVEGLGSGG